MKILITGGCGFIGTNAALHFLKMGHEVIVIDNLSRSGSWVNSQFLRAKVDKGGKLEVVTRPDVGIDKDSYFLKDLLFRKIDVILHVAAQVAVTSSVADPVRDFEINARGTLNVLEAARSLEKKPIVIFTSTNKVYGGMEDVAVVEQGSRYCYKDKPLGISEKQLLDFHSPYGCSKGSADQYVRDYYRIYNLPTVVFRQSCIYGPHQFGIVDQGWVSFLTASAFFGRPITIYGDGKQVRDILFIDDLNRAFESAIKNIEKTRGQIYNIGGGPRNTVSILEFISILERLFFKKIKVNFSAWRPGDQKVFISDISKARADFYWKPMIDIEKGIARMVRWVKANRKILEKMT